MNILTRNTLHIAAAAALVALTGCVTAPPMVGEKPDTVPPQLRTSQKTGLLEWDRLMAFGKVSGPLKATGDVACMSAAPEYEALGYHPRAKDEKGNEMPGGGFLCKRKDNGDKPDAKAPQLKPDGNSFAWDRPGAFGKVPEEIKESATRACNAAGGQRMRAIGFHPKAMDAQGKPFPTGGFLCFPDTQAKA